MADPARRRSSISVSGARKLASKVRTPSPSTTLPTSRCTSSTRPWAYVPAGEVPLGSFAPAEPSAKEVNRRAKWAREAG